ncbi:VanZ family protein [Cohnella fermenti]|uniref:VanZ family protein n=1 Tax=Cohnella fermenti TaxID=2565925 RepID=UPI001454E181|nr:VanZ family protein [Cohnella fermenti]
MTSRHLWNRVAALSLLVVVVFAIFAFSNQPYRVQTIQPLLQRTLSIETVEKVLPALDIRYDGHEYRRDVNPFGLIEFLFRKGAHLFVYASLAASAALVLSMFRLRPVRVAALSLLAVLIVATLDEWNQQFSSARTPAYQDVFVDLTGGAIGLMAGYGVWRLVRRRRG